ncbi:hypothetical protein EAI_16858 [Harpegnathos saltator]|uniref:Mitochondrial splicing suppressor 51-like C-terminal domain-containing protein n=1 Tax=Harpegnathos saltator TaxID=610380 RepID=E2C2A4_HARSA|nr:hypothetical protein EAI_16858 [Harpegnathos saltator]
MILYCNEEHKRLHRPQHEDICTLITRFVTEDPDWDTRRLYFQDWIKLQKNFMRLAEVTLGRNLKTYEEQMFLFAKSCFICHRRSDLFTCEKCISISYCVDHESESSLHEFNCDDLALNLNLDIIFLEKEAWEALSIKFYNFPDKKRLYTDMDSFCSQYYRERSRRRSEWDLNTCAFTDYVSGPLTLYNGLQSANLFHPEKVTHAFVIHIIVTSNVDRRNFPAWELFLHFLSKKKKLIVVMIGLELKRETCEHVVCSRCKTAKKKLILESYPLLYHNYMSSANYRRPNVVIGFQAELNHGDAWSESIKAIKAQNCPLLLTAKSQLKAHWDVIEIGKILNTTVKPFFINENYFASRRPYKDYETGYIFLPNTYFIIYKNLNGPSKTTKESCGSHL